MGADRRGWSRAAVAVVARPLLWRTALRQARRLVPRGWWRQPPFWPRPDRAYLAFRLETQYGDPAASPSAADVVAYLRWCRAQDRLAGRPGSPRPSEARQ